MDDLTRAMLLDPSRRLVWNDAARTALRGLSDTDLDLVCGWIMAHEEPIADDCSDGPTVALELDADAMRRSEHTCCGWEESHFTVGGLALVCGSCHGH